MEEGGSRLQAEEGRNEWGARGRALLVVQPKTLPTHTRMFAVGKQREHRGRVFRAVCELDMSYCTRAFAQKDAAPELRECQMHVREAYEKQRKTGVPSTQSESIHYHVDSDTGRPSIANSKAVIFKCSMESTKTGSATARTQAVVSVQWNSFF